MRTLTGKQGTVAVLAVWLVVLLIFLSVQFIVGPENQWWVTAIYVAVIAVATSLTIKIPPYQAVDDSAGQDSKQTR
jgi:regulator of protease activity HflC (stomatin/prohibitin superfamily)